MPPLFAAAAATAAASADECVWCTHARARTHAARAGEELLRSEETADRAAAKLTQIAVDHGFDGWLINIENNVDPGERVDVLAHFLRSLTGQMRAATLADNTSVGGGSSSSTAVPVTSGGGPEDGKPGTAGTAGGHSRSTVLWYDSVTVEGKLVWQDRLNGENRVFFDACDGIFSNYAWEAHYPSACALEAQARRCVQPRRWPLA